MAKKKLINLKRIIQYWKNSSEKDHQVAQSLFNSKHYSQCLFFCHLSLEKLTKGLIVKRVKTHAPFVHELDTLVRKAKLELSKEQKKNLEIINTFNIRARYDDLRFSFYKKCDKRYTEKYFNIFKELHLWLKKQYLRK